MGPDVGKKDIHGGDPGQEGWRKEARQKKGENVGAGTKVASSVAVEREVAVII